MMQLLRVPTCEAVLQGSGSATLNVYEMDGIFLYGQTFGPASETGYSGNAALKYFAQNGI